MRVLVATGAFQDLTSAQTGAAMARAWAELGAQCAVVPIAETGQGFGRAWADLVQAGPTDWSDVEVFAADGGMALRFVDENPAEADEPSSSERLGVSVAALLAWAEHDGRPLPELWLEVPAWTWGDGGAGFWHATRQCHARLRGLRLHLVTTSAQAGLQLTGLRGITAATMHTTGAHPGELLAADQRLVDWCTSMGDPALGTTQGAGAVGGLGAAVLALGGDIVTGPREIARQARLADSVQQADLVVTGYDELDFGSKGGDLVPVVTELAESAGRPVVALARHNWISARELRTMGVEQGYALQSEDQGEAEVLTADGITAACRTIAGTWHW